MKTLLELIESWNPCERYDRYIAKGILTPQTTIKNVIFSRNITSYDKNWFFYFLLSGNRPRFTFLKFRKKGVVLKKDVSHNYIHYDYETFLAMVYEYLEHAGLDVAI